MFFSFQSEHSDPTLSGTKRVKKFPYQKKVEEILAKHQVVDDDPDAPTDSLKRGKSYSIYRPSIRP